MPRKVNVHVEHLTRVEGHGNIILKANDGTVEKIVWEVSEAPRFFEAFVRGKEYKMLSHITSRICGICSIGHALASLKATEAAMDVPISEQTLLLRKLALHGENLQSHILHVGYLVAPDLFGVGSVIPLAGTNPAEVGKIIKLHRLANTMSDLICGRTTHPITLDVGGFTAIPTEKQLLDLKSSLEEALPVAGEVAELVAANAGALPDFVRETEFIGLVSNEEYPLYGGSIGSTDTGTHPVEEYLSVTNEYNVPQSTAKYTKHARESYMVGALARFNLNYDLLDPAAKAVANRFGLKPVCHNPFMNSVAQIVEIVHSLKDSINIIDTLIAKGLEEEEYRVIVKPGRGISAVEVPRGILFHDYTYDENGRCTKANCIIPTNQNHANIQKDMEALAPTIIDRPEKEIELTLEMLVRAYDPCISCSTHYLKVDWKR